MLVEALSGAPPASVLPRRRRMPGREVPQQRPRTAVHAACRPRAVLVLAAVEVAVHPPHQPVEHVTGAMASAVVILTRQERYSCYVQLWHCSIREALVLEGAGNSCRELRQSLHEPPQFPSQFLAILRQAVRIDPFSAHPLCIFSEFPST